FDPRTLRTVGALAPGTYIQFRNPDGTLAAPAISLLPPGEQQTAPDLPRALPELPNDGPFASRYFTVAAKGGGTDFRVRESPLPDGYTLVVASSLRGVADTLHRLFLIELAVAGGVLAGLLALAYWLVRLGLRPLTAIESTAAQIAAGDYSRRVERDDPHTEVG